MLTIDELPELSTDNYYSQDQSFKYLSATFTNVFIRNPREAWDRLVNGWKPEHQDDTPLLVGNYLHSYFESPEAHAKFIEEHPEIISSTGKTKGQLKAPYKCAEDMIKAIERQKNVMKIINAAQQHEVMVTGKINGVDYKGKVDGLDVAHGMFIDYKTNIDPYKAHWVKDEYGNIERSTFIKDFGYYRQMAIYRELLKQTYGKEFFCFLIVVSKEKVPKVGLVSLPTLELEQGLHEAEEAAPHFRAVLNGEEFPEIKNDGGEYYWTHYQIKHPILPDELIGD